jgi:hypothetical protein
MTLPFDDALLPMIPGLISILQTARVTVRSRAALQLEILAYGISSKFFNGHGESEWRSASDTASASRTNPSTICGRSTTEDSRLPEYSRAR